MATIPAAFPTSAALKRSWQAVTANSASPPSVSDEVIEEARSASYHEILSRLVARGYTQAQIDAWDRLAEFGRHIALWWFWRERVGANQGDTNPDVQPLHWDRRTELDTVVVTEDGVVVDPDDLSGAEVLSGRMDVSDEDVFTAETQW